MSQAEPTVKILVMDDEADIRDLVDLMLAKHGVHTVKAADWTAGMRALREHADIELVLLDLTLPGVERAPIDAVQAARPGTPVVIMSGYGAPQGDQMPGEFLPVAFLQKPFKPAALYQTIERHVDAFRAPATRRS